MHCESPKNTLASGGKPHHAPSVAIAALLATASLVQIDRLPTLRTQMLHGVQRDADKALAVNIKDDTIFASDMMHIIAKYLVVT